MIKEKLIQVLKSRLGSRNDDDIDEMLMLELELAQTDDLEANGRATPWFLYSEAATIGTTIGEERIKLPGDFLREVEEGTLSIYVEELGKFAEIIRDDYDTLSAKYLYSAPGIPRHYALEGHYFRLFPRPDNIYTIRMRYVQKDVLPSIIDSDKENLWMKWAPNLLLAVAARRYASMHLMNPALATLFAAEATESWDRLVTQSTARKNTNRNFVMGGDE